MGPSRTMTRLRTSLFSKATTNCVISRAPTSRSMSVPICRRRRYWTIRGHRRRRESRFNDRHRNEMNELAGCDLGATDQDQFCTAGATSSKRLNQDRKCGSRIKEGCKPRKSRDGNGTGNTQAGCGSQQRLRARATRNSASSPRRRGRRQFLASRPVRQSRGRSRRSGMVVDDDLHP